jgi:tight adherence protein B
MMDFDRDLDLKRALLDDACCNGVVCVRPLARLLMRVRPLPGICEKAANAVSDKVPAANARSICELLIVASCVVVLLAYLLCGQLVFAACCAMIPFALASYKATQWALKRKAMMREQIPDALAAVGMCFQAGFSLQQALGQSAMETPSPFGEQLQRTARDMEVGHSVSEALRDLEARTQISDLEYVIVALEIQHSTGGSLKDLLDRAAASVTSSFELARSLEVQTAQARMSARIVTVMPIVLVAVLSLAMDGYLQTFFSSTSGMTLLACALTMNVAGILVIRKILGLDLE